MSPTQERPSARSELHKSPVTFRGSCYQAMSLCCLPTFVEDYRPIELFHDNIDRSASPSWLTAAAPMRTPVLPLCLVLKLGGCQPHLPRHVQRVQPVGGAALQLPRPRRSPRRDVFRFALALSRALGTPTNGTHVHRPQRETHHILHLSNDCRNEPFIRLRPARARCVCGDLEGQGTAAESLRVVETCPVSTGGRDETCPVSTGGRGDRGHATSRGRTTGEDRRLRAKVAGEDPSS